MLVVVAVVIALAVAGAVATLARASCHPQCVPARRRDRQRALLLAQARREADSTRREAQIEAREEAVSSRAELEGDFRDRRDEAAKTSSVAREEDDIDAEADGARAGASRASPIARCT